MRTHRVACLAYSGLTPFEIGVAAEVFALQRPELDVDWWYSFKLCAEQPGPLEVVGGFQIVARHGLSLLSRADTIVVPGVADVHGDPSPELVAALRRAHRRGARIVSICSGAFALAGAGLLDGREVATHWRYAELLQRRYPRVRVNSSVLYLDDGDVLTSAGTAAGIDLCLHLIRADHGAEIANRVARRMVVAPHRDGGQAQFIERPVSTVTADDPIGRATHAALERLAEPMTIAELARVAHLSPRQFERRFRAATGMSPGRWLIQQRIEASLPLLESESTSIERVAELVGFSPAGYRRHFQALRGVPPSSYRRQFASARAAA
jgi:AraC family transcriptional regulator, transcriptional activator FtrA